MIATTEQVGGKKTRVKIPSPAFPLGTREEAEAELHCFAWIANLKRNVTAEMDAELLTIKTKYQPLLTGYDQQLERAGERLAEYANTHPEIFPKNRKSVEWSAGKFGFRIDTPSLALANRTFGWAKILAVIIAKRLRKFVRVKQEVDKDAILARCGTLEKPTKFQIKTLPNLGLKIVQEEKFFVEPDLTKAEVRS